MVVADPVLTLGYIGLSFQVHKGDTLRMPRQSSRFPCQCLNTLLLSLVVPRGTFDAAPY